MSQENQLLKTDIFLPPTSPEYGATLVDAFYLETDVRFGDKKRTGSDLWIDMVMNMGTELQAIQRFKDNLKLSSPELNDNQIEGEFENLLEMYLRTQFQFCLAENGCNKHLQIQPDYFFDVLTDQNGIFVVPTDLSKFGDLSKKYIQANPRVGAGLKMIYELIATNPDAKLGVGIMSPSEEYKGFGSEWDVINLLKKDTGKYLICKRVLTTSERRFVHNLFYELGKGSITLNDLLQKTTQELHQLIPTHTLKTTSAQTTNVPEYQYLTSEPNHFQLENETTDLFTIACQLNTIFFNRFGEELFGEQDIKMYPIINQLTEAYLPDLQRLLLRGEKQPYYKLIRQMIYHCQALWKINNRPQKSQQTIESYRFIIDDDIYDHLWGLATGVIFAGFEFADNGDNPFDPFSSTSNPFDFSQPPGWETVKKCKTHGEYEGGSCPKCPNKSD